jgi:protein-L-isoaspartate(D-aspartate) O-methyltransferase
MNLNERRRFYAEEIQATANLKSAAVIEALASVPRERFLRPGPWTVRGESDFMQPPRQTADADPRHVYHNLAIALDPARQLFNGAPGLIAMAIDLLMLNSGARVLHIGSGTGYYTALMAHCVGPEGRVVAIEVDPQLAADARANLGSMPWVEVRQADGTGDLGSSFDAVLVNAGVTHPLASWLDALDMGGRMILPLTTAVAPTIGKGPMFLLTRTDRLTFDARPTGFVAIYSAVGLRSDAHNERLAQLMKSNPFPPVKRLRLDQHESSAACWLHWDGGCLSMGEASAAE